MANSFTHLYKVNYAMSCLVTNKTDKPVHIMYTHQLNILWVHNIIYSLNNLALESFPSDGLSHSVFFYPNGAFSHIVLTVQVTV